MANGAPTVSNGLVISGVTTSTTFSGSGASLTNLPSAQLTGALPALDGSNLTGITQTTINNNGSNRIITGSSTANTLEGEATFTYDGVSKAKIDTSQTYGYLQLDGNSGGSIEFFANGTRKFEIYGIDAGIEIYDREKGSYHSKFLSGGNVEISDGKLLIGTTTEGVGNADDLTIATSSDTGMTIRSGSSSSGRLFFSDGTSGTDEYTGGFEYSHGDNSMRFFTNGGTERLRIDSSGRLLLGTTTAGHTDLDDLTISTSGNTGVTIRSGTSSLGVVGFADGTSGNTQYRGVIQYRHSNDSMEFNTADAQRMKIDGNGFVTMPGQCSFRATKSGGPYNNGTHTAVWDQNQHNTGSNYNTSNGRFTAPVTGIYIFHAYSIYTGNSSNDTWDFQKNGSNFPGSRVHFTNNGVGGAWDSVANTCIVSLSANDYITVRASSQEYHGGDWTAFCGSLLS